MDLLGFTRAAPGQTQAMDLPSTAERSENPGPIEACAGAEAFLFRYVTANDTGQTGSHQAGMYMPRDSWRMFLREPGQKGENSDVWVDIQWASGEKIRSRFVWYGKGTRSEYRLTNGFSFLKEENTGDLLVLARTGADTWRGYLLTSDEETEDFIAALGLSPDDSGRIHWKGEAESELEADIRAWLAALPGDFPTSEAISARARELTRPLLSGRKSMALNINLDELILKWIDMEYRIFRIIERARYQHVLDKPFGSLDEMIQTSLTILNRRKSRAGYSLELHLCYILDFLGLPYSFQELTEGTSRPDFIFPGKQEYSQSGYPSGSLRFLGVKTTCKDRWRQILSEAERIPRKHLFTLQQGISSNQLDEMQRSGVVLVVPEPYRSSFPEKFRKSILSLREFLDELGRLHANRVTEGGSDYKLF